MWQLLKVSLNCELNYTTHTRYATTVDIEMLNVKFENVPDTQN